LPEAVWNVAVQFSRNFSAASLRLDDDRQADPFAACVRCRDALFSRSSIFECNDLQHVSKIPFSSEGATLRAKARIFQDPKRHG